MPTQPRNAIVIMSDQHAAEALSLFGSAVQTPNLDRLAQRSTVFTNAYCNSPVCGPSRLSFLTGQYVHQCKGWDNATTRPVDQPTMGHLMTAAGYHTVFSGRMHLHGMDQLIGFEERPVHDLINPIDSPPEDCYHSEVGPLEIIADRDTAYPENDHVQLNRDDHVIEAAIETLKQHRSQDQRPLFLLVGLCLPHPSMSGRPQYREFFDYYMSQELNLPDVNEETIKTLPSYIRRLLAHNSPISCTPESKKRNLADYFARIHYMDQLLGAFLTAAEEGGYLEDSVILYTSDHGENQGYHGGWGKMNFYDRAAKVPLFFYAPQAAPRRAEDLVSLVDVFATLAEVANHSVIYPIAGESLLPLLEGHKRSTNEIFSEYHGHYSNCAGFMVRRDNWKYCYYNAHEPELYDLAADPEELYNLAGNPAHAARQQELHELLLQIVPDPAALEQEVRENQQRRQLIADAVTTSKAVQLNLRVRIHSYRSERDEPWWDGGEYMKRYESQFTQIDCTRTD